MNIDIDKDEFRSIGGISDGIASGLRQERVWDGGTITEPGIYSGISLDTYHGKLDLLDGPSVSKSALKWIFPSRDGSPKAFWGRWSHNPDRIDQKTTSALNFGKATHCLMLGDEVFEEAFAIRPDVYSDYKTKDARAWRDAVIALGKTPVTPEEIVKIQRMADDAAQNPVVRAGILNGRVERSMFSKDADTGIWLRGRPDTIAADGIYADLKTTSSLSESFLERQAHDCGYFLQAAVTRIICRELGMPFDTFALVYLLNDDVPDTAHVELDQFDIDRAEKEIRWALKAIRHGLDTGEWPGLRPFADGTKRLQVKTWEKERIDRFLELEQAA